MEEEEKIVMMMISSTTRSSCPDRISNSNSSLSHDQQPITSCNWKLYQNPFYNKQPHHHRGNNTRFPHRPHRPLPSARKIAASFWDLAFFRPASMIGQTGKDDAAAARVNELKSELERERRARLKLEHINKKLVKELCEQRSGREALERVCEKLAKEISCDRASIDRMKREIEEEREMLRMAEVMRKEKLQMKLAEAKVFLEEKISKLDHGANTDIAKEVEEEEPKGVLHRCNFSSALTAWKPARKPPNRLALMEKLPSWSLDNVVGTNSDRSKAVTAFHRRLSPLPEPENPHIKRGIRGSVEFQRVVRAIGSKGQTLGSKKIECQKAHIRILLKHSSAIRSTDNNLIRGSRFVH